MKSDDFLHYTSSLRIKLRMRKMEITLTPSPDLNLAPSNPKRNIHRTNKTKTSVHAFSQIT